VPAKPRTVNPRPSPDAAASTRDSARAVALEALLTLERSATNLGADEILEALLQASRLDVRDRALTWELAYGVLRHRSILDWRLKHVSDRPIERLPMIVRTVLRLAAYQLLYLERIPASAAVNESVKLAKAARARRGKDRLDRDWSGYVNGVLRSLLREAAPSLPSTDLDALGALSLRYSCPPWLVTRWLRRFGLAGAEQLCHQTQAIPPLTLRVNTLKITREELEAELVRAGQAAHPTQVSATGLLIEKPRPSTVARLPQFERGLFYIEDEAAQLIPPLLDPKPGERILDACAAPGGKTTHLAALMANHGEIVAVDQSPARLHLLEENCRRLDVRIVDTVQADLVRELRTPGARLAEALAQPFDRILLDAPCSGLGVLRRHPEGKWQKREASLTQHHDTQLEMLTLVAQRLRPGGVLLYSTCSTEPDENEAVVEEFCRSEAGFHLESVGPWLPASAQHLVTDRGYLSTTLNSASMDGFFAARVRRA
jgi:16S rRNA (cytosine967-C5)-methyltransferase